VGMVCSIILFSHGIHDFGNIVLASPSQLFRSSLHSNDIPGYPVIRSLDRSMLQPAGRRTSAVPTLDNETSHHTAFLSFFSEGPYERWTARSAVTVEPVTLQRFPFCFPFPPGTFYLPGISTVATYHQYEGRLSAPIVSPKNASACTICRYLLGLVYIGDFGLCCPRPSPPRSTNGHEAVD